MLIKNAAIWYGSTFDDYKSKNWTELNFNENITGFRLKYKNVDKINNINF